MDPIKVRSLAEVRKAVEGVGWDVDLEFLIDEKTTLEDARDILKHMSMAGEHGVVVNPVLVLNKEGALEFVERKITHLLRWKAYFDTKVAKLDEKLGLLGSVIDQGGPGARAYHAASGGYKGKDSFIDTEEVVDDEGLAAHIAQLRALILEASPSTPAADGFFSLPASVGREEAEQLEASRFNVSYLEVKRDAAALLSEFLAQAIPKLQAQFLRHPTCLGAESGDFGRFQDVVVHVGEAVRAVGPSDT